MEALLSPLVAKLLGAIAVLGALAAAYFGIKQKGVKEERDRQEIKTAKARAEIQARVDEARSQDAVIDQKTDAKVVEIRKKTEPAKDPPGGYKPGDIFKFTFALFLLLGACSYVRPATPVAVDIPLRPQLPECQTKAEVQGTVVQGEGGLMVAIPLDQAKALSAWVAAFAACSAVRETVLTGHIEKLENRLKALGGR